MGCCLSTKNLPLANSSPEHGVQQPGRDVLDDTHTDKSEEIVITSIRATDVAVGLERVPAGFYAAVCYNGLEWRTENKPVSMNNIADWTGLIPLPSDFSASVSLAVRASFELQPMLGNGEELRVLAVTVEQLLDHTERNLEFAFPQDGQDKPCSSLLVTVRRWGNDLVQAGVLAPHRPATDIQAQLDDVTDQGHNALLQYRKHGDEEDLEFAIEQFEDVISICPPGHPCDAAAQSNLATAKLFRCRVRRGAAFFEVPLTLYRNALVARPVGHPDRARTLVQLAAVHLMRFAEQRDDVDVKDVEALLQEVINLNPTESHEHQAAVSMLQLLNEHVMETIQACDQSPAVQDPTSGVTDVLRQNIFLLGYFERFGDLATLEQAISGLEASLGSNSPRDQQPFAELAVLGVLLRHRYDNLGELNDLEEAISKQREAVQLTPDGHPQKSMFLNSLGNSLLTRFELLREPNDLEEAIASQRDAVHLTPSGRSDKPALLNNLAFSLTTRFERVTGELRDLDDAILRKRDVIDLTADSDREKPAFLNSLANSLLTRFERLGEPSDLEEAILKQKDALRLTPNGKPEKPGILNDLAISLLARFERVAGELGDLEEAISTQRDAIDLTADDDLDKAAFLSSLGHSLATRFERLGELGDLEEAILIQQNAIDIAPDGYPYKPQFLSNLSDSLRIRFERLGQLNDLEEAISKQRDALDLTPEVHLAKIGCLNNLGIFLRARFEHLGEPGDLEEAISRQEDAVALILNVHPDKPSILNNLALTLLSHFERFGQLSGLEEAIMKQRDVIRLTPDDHPLKPVFLNNLSISLTTRFKRLGELNDIEEAISKQRDGVEITSEGHPDKPRYLHNLGAALIARFNRLGELSDLEEAILWQQAAVDLSPNGHSYKPGFLNNLGNSFRTRFMCLGGLNDLEESVSRLRDAVHHTPDGHPEKHVHLQNLGGSLRTRYEYLKEQNDLEETISRLQNAVDLTPDGHPHKSLLYCLLGESSLARFELLRHLDDLEQSILLFSHAACATAGPISVRFHASRRWVFCSRLLGHHTLLQAYSVAIGLLPQLAWIGLSLADRYRELKEAADVVREAAATALDSEQPETAVEWLEQGRSIVWGEMFQLRSSYDELSSAYPDHARRLRELSTALEHASVAREQSVFLSSKQVSGAQHHTVESLEQVANKHRRLAIDRDKLLEDIRRLPGFERFLLRKDFSELRSAARAGPVVIVNAAETRCDALIILADVERVIHVPLSKFTLQRSIDLQSSLKGFIRDARDSPRDGREGRPIPHGNNSQLDPILATLWKCIVKPVLDALALSIPEEPTRIFWCPTGPLTFLPIHAAGFYDVHHSQPGHKVYDFVVSSYIPTLSILSSSFESNPPSATNLRLLAVRQPPSDGQRKLPGAITELEHIRTAIRNSPSSQITLVESSAGTVEEVLALMKDADWVHFACHGVQDTMNPTASGLCLADERRLTLSNVVSLSRPRGGLAFLSACQTAKGDEKLSDEATHIAAGMLYAGYGGVIGTMWAISDKHAPTVAKDVYEQLFLNGGRPDCRDAAQALHIAVGRLRNNNVSFWDWLPFIHVGL